MQISSERAGWGWGQIIDSYPLRCLGAAPNVFGKGIALREVAREREGVGAALKTRRRAGGKQD